MKRCSKCSKDKPPLEFYPCKGGKFGVRSWCKECDKTSTRQWRADNPDKSRAVARTWNENNRDRRRDGHLRRQYGITLVEQNELLERQGGVCAICGLPLNERTLNIDHVHEGEVRGILCPECNKGLGLFQDSPGHLAAAIE